MSINIVTLIFAIVSAISLCGLIVMFALPRRILADDNRWRLLPPEGFACICFSMFISFGILALQCSMM